MNKDVIQKFYFAEHDIKGAWIRLDRSLDAVLEHQSLPQNIEQLLIEALAACVAMSSSLKFDGTLSIQARSTHADIALFIVEVAKNSQVLHIRGTATLSESSDLGDPKHKLVLTDALKGGYLTVTIAAENKQAYQGIVSLEHATLAGCLEDYFKQSEQLASKLLLAVDGRTCTALFLQKMPNSSPALNALWQECLYLLETVEDSELLNEDAQTMLYRLFHQYELYVYPGQNIVFACRCSWEKTDKALMSIGQEEAMNLLAEQERIDVACDFCGQHYVYGWSKLEALFDIPSQDQLN